MRSVTIREIANTEIAETADWYDDRSDGLGDEFLADIDWLVDLMVSFPRSFPLMSDEFRRAHLRRFPYTIFYRVLVDRIVIVACLHDARDTEQIVKNRT